MTSEMVKLRRLLDAEGIAWVDASDEKSIYHIDRTHFRYRRYRWSVIHGYGTYGGKNHWDKDMGLLELRSNGAGNGDPIGWLTADEVMRLVKGEQKVE